MYGLKSPLLGSYWLYDNNVFRVIKLSRATDEVIIRSVTDKKEYSVALSIFRFSYEPVYPVREVSKWVNRSTRYLKQLEADGKTTSPLRVPDTKGWPVRWYTKQAAIELYEDIRFIHQGRPGASGRVVNNTMPDPFSFNRLIQEKYRGLK